VKKGKSKAQFSLRERKEPLILFLITAILLFLSLPDLGLTWDEPFYIQYALSYFSWFSHPQLHSILNHFPEEDHPPLAKYLIGTTLLLFSPWLDPLTSARISTIILSSFLVMLTFLIVRSLYGKPAAYFASLSLLSIPRLFGHMHFATLDLPLTLLFLLGAYFFSKASSWKRAFTFSFIWALAISTKSSGVFLLPPLLLWGVLYRRKEILPSLITSLTFSPLLFFLFWPRMWMGPVIHLKEFVLHQLKRIPIPVLYMGKVYGKGIPTPWHYPWLMLLFTLPPIFLFLSLMGFFLILKERKEDTLFIFPPLFFLLMVSLPQAQKYDGIRLFLPVLPFLAVWTGKGFSYLWNRRKKNKFLLYLLLLPSFFSLLRVHPYYLSYYNCLVGGVKGAWERGMEITYWGESINENIFKYLNSFSKKGALISFYPVGYHQVKFYSFLGYLRPDLEGKDTIDPHSQYIVLQMRRGLFHSNCYRILKISKPIYGNYYEGVPLVLIFRTQEVKELWKGKP